MFRILYSRPRAARVVVPLVVFVLLCSAALAQHAPDAIADSTADVAARHDSIPAPLAVGESIVAAPSDAAPLASVPPADDPRADAPVDAATDTEITVDGFIVAFDSRRLGSGDSTSGFAVVPALDAPRVPVTLHGVKRSKEGGYSATRITSAPRWNGSRLASGTSSVDAVDATSLTITPDGSHLSLDYTLQLPGLGRDAALRFAAPRVAVTSSGIAGTARLGLVESERVRDAAGVEYRFTSGESGSEDLSSVELDAAGVSAARLAMEVTFPREWMRAKEMHVPGALAESPVSVPVAYEYRRDDAAHGAGLGNWIARGAMPEFVLASDPAITIGGGDLVVDQSVVSGDRLDAEWTGAFVAGALVHLPPAFHGSNGESVAMNVPAIAIDGSGLSFQAELTSPAPIRFGAWLATLGAASLSVSGGRVTAATANGGVRIPDFDRDVRFTGSIATGGERSTLALEPIEDLRIDRWHSMLDVTGGSLEIDADGIARTVLAGSMTVDSTVGDITRIQLHDIHFEGMVVRSDTRVITQPVWSHASPQHGVGAYPFAITKITDDDAGSGGLAFHSALNLADDDVDMRAEAELQLRNVLNDIGLPISLTECEGGTTFRVSFSDVELAPKLLTVSGALEYTEGNATYGDYWFGAIRAEVMEKAGVEAVAQFGTMFPDSSAEYKYFFVDVFAFWNQGVAIGTTGAFLYGVGGGFAYNMEIARVVGGVVVPYDETAHREESQTGGELPDDGEEEEEVEPCDAADEFPAGRGLDGLAYLPDLGSKVAKVIVELGSARQEMAKGRISFSVQFSGAWDVVALHVRGQLMVITTGEDASVLEAAIDGHINLDPLNVVIDGYVNLDAQKIGMTAYIPIHAELGGTRWQIAIGTPDDPVTMTLNALGLDMEGYLMLGQDVPPARLPDEFADLFPEVGDLFDITGDGFSFGASFTKSWGGSWAGIGFDLTARLGFGLSLLKYDVTCEGGYKLDIGADGWYGMGNIYGSLKFTIHLLFWSPSIGIDAAAIGGGPNPWWMKGAVRVKYLGSFKFSIGDPPTTCDPQLALPDDIVVSLEPDASSTSPFRWGEAQLRIGIKEEFELKMQGPPSGGTAPPPVTYTLRPTLHQFTLAKTATPAVPVLADVSIDDEERTVSLAQRDALEGSTAYRLTLVLRAEYLDGSRWRPWVQDDGTPVELTETAEFTTAPRPQTIPDWNIAFATPLDRQRNFYVGDGAGPARVHLKTAASYLFDGRDVDVRLVPLGGTDTVTVNATVRAKVVDFRLPVLEPSRFYRAEIVRGRTGPTGGRDSILSWTFRTSAYPTLAAKVATMTLESPVATLLDSNWVVKYDTIVNPNESVTPMGAALTITEADSALRRYRELSYGLDELGEGFDLYELKGFDYDIGLGRTEVAPLLKIRSLPSSPWHIGFYQDTILPLVDLSLKAARRAEREGFGISSGAAASYEAYLRTQLGDSVRAVLLNDDEIDATALDPFRNERGKLRVEYRDELVAWAFWRRAVLVDYTLLKTPGRTSALPPGTAFMEWQPLREGRYDISAWYEPRWWIIDRVGGPVTGRIPPQTPGVISFDFLP